MDGVLPAIEETSLTERIVLLALADAANKRETPVASVDVRPRCLKLCEEVETEVVSRPNESDVMRALSVLGAESYVEEIQHESSAVGKGRPQYDLSAEVETVMDALAADERLEKTVEAVRNH